MLHDLWRSFRCSPVTVSYWFCGILVTGWGAAVDIANDTSTHRKKNARSIHHGELAPISGICQGNILRWWLRFLWSVTSRTILAGTGTKITLRSDSVWIRDWLETVLNYDAINTGFPFSKDSQKNLANDGNRSRGNWFDGLMLEEKN